MGPVNELISRLDANAGGYGYSQDGFGLVPGGNPTNYSVNPAIAAKTAGKNTMQVTISAARTGGGSGSVSDPIFLFGSNAFTNASVGYTAVQNSNQITAVGTSGGKNVVTFKYLNGGDPAKYTTYTVTLTTAGEYPYVLNSFSGGNKMRVYGMQIQISDAAQAAQLQAGLKTFYLDQFGKSTQDDLTTPTDLYQQATNGVFIPHEFEISGSRGLVANILNVDGFSVSYYMYVGN